MMVTLATESDKKQIIELRKITEKILWSSIKNQRRSNAPNEIGSLIGVSLSAFKQKLGNSYLPDSWSDDINNIVLGPQHCIDNLESRLCLALQRIQSKSVKELFNIIRINKHNGPEAAIDHILSPYEIPLVPVYSQLTVGMKQLDEISLTPLDSESEEL